MILRKLARYVSTPKGVSKLTANLLSLDHKFQAWPEALGLLLYQDREATAKLLQEWNKLQKRPDHPFIYSFLNKIAPPGELPIRLYINSLLEADPAHLQFYAVLTNLKNCLLEDQQNEELANPESESFVLMEEGFKRFLKCQFYKNIEEHEFVVLLTVAKLCKYFRVQQPQLLQRISNHLLRNSNKLSSIQILHSLNFLACFRALPVVYFYNNLGWLLKLTENKEEYFIKGEKVVVLLCELLARFRHPSLLGSQLTLLEVVEAYKQGLRKKELVRSCYFMSRFLVQADERVLALLQQAVGRPEQTSELEARMVVSSVCELQHRGFLKAQPRDFRGILAGLQDKVNSNYFRLIIQKLCQ